MGISVSSSHRLPFFIAPWFDTSESMLHLISLTYMLRLLFPPPPAVLLFFLTSAFSPFHHHSNAAYAMVLFVSYRSSFHTHTRRCRRRRSHCVSQVKRKFSVFISISTIPHIRKSRTKRRGFVFIFR